MGPIGIAVNPASGKDVRRLVARASVFDNQEKRAIVRRAIAGALGGGARDFVYVPDSHHIAESAFAEHGSGFSVRALEAAQSQSALDTIRGAAACRDAGCTVVVTLGGDGTNRAFVKGWPDAPLLPISTGTNNVFPRLVEATVAGAAAGLVASGRVALADCTERSKRVLVDVEGEDGDVALIDAVLSIDRFIGARALLDADSLVLAVLTRADPAAVGITAIGGLVRPTPASAPDGLLVELGEGGRQLDAPIAPGLYRTVGVRDARRLPAGEVVEVRGPGVLAFDGERERVLKPGQRAWLRIDANGPWVVDVRRALEVAACRGAFFRREATDEERTAHAR